MSRAEQEIENSTVQQVRHYLVSLDTYIRLVSQWNKLDIAGRREAERLRQELLVRQAQMKAVVGDVLFRQFDTTRSAWDGLHEFDPFYSQSILTRLKLLKDEVTVCLGKLQAVESSGARPSPYELTNPLYWFMRLLDWLKSMSKRVLAWGSLHKLWSFLLASITLIGSVLAIVNFFT